MREKVARISAKKHAENPPCHVCYAIADETITLIRGKIEKVENPYETEGRHWQLQIKAFEDCRQAILALFKEK